jgi:hypothetical protein
MLVRICGLVYAGRGLCVIDLWTGWMLEYQSRVVSNDVEEWIRQDKFWCL